VRNFVAQENGATAIEYALVAGLVSILIITGVTTIGSDVANLFLGPVAAGLR
jgi:pilus assembly protein Flp/PilA